MSFQTIRHAQQAVWPRVRQSLDIRRTQREAVHADPAGATVAATARARIPWNRVVADETVWAIAKENLLVSPEAAAVIKSARAWASEVVKDLDMSELMPDEVALYDAVQSLASTLRDMEEESVDG